MKIFILFTFLVAAFANDNLLPGQTPCGQTSGAEWDVSTPPGGTRGPCEYWQKCVTVRDKSSVWGVPPAGSVTKGTDDYFNSASAQHDLSFCMDKENTQCNRYSDLGDSGTIVSVTQCTPTQKCCQGTCCNLFSEACMVRTEGEFTYGWGKSIYESWTKDTVKPKDMKQWWFQAEEVSRNDWKTDAGAAITNMPMMCTKKQAYMNQMAGFKVIYMPTLGVLMTIWAIMLVKNNGKVDKSQTFMPCTMIGCALLGWFSYYQFHYVFSVAIALATVTAPANWTSWVLFFQLALIWFFLGGKSFLISDTSFYGGPTGSGGANGNFLADWGTESTPAMSNCATYFNFFGFEPNSGGAPANNNGNHKYGDVATGNGGAGTTPPSATSLTGNGNMKWWSSGDRKGWGYCSYEWLGFQQFLFVSHLFAFIAMIYQTIVRTMNGGDGGGSFTEAIVTRQTSKV